MTRLQSDKLRQSLIDVSNGDVTFEDGRFVPSPGLTEAAARLMERDNGFVVVYGAGALLASRRLDLAEHRDLVYALYEDIFRKAMQHVEFARYNVTKRDFTLAYMDVDGYQNNKNFSHDGKVDGREYSTTKCIHFDTATPFVANVYGPNRNIEGGYPVIADVPAYCRDHGVAPRDMVTNIPANYNVAIREEHYQALLDDYSFCVKVNLDTDMVMVMLSNEVEFGVAHGATDPRRIVPGEASARPIRHYEYQYHAEEHYAEWLDYYGIAQSEIRDHDGTVNLSLDYYKKGNRIHHVIEVGN
ncbi:hypothetical protein WI36_03585 [Burkholderia ubonensis]|uniref:Uncharacterized protein n=1 Tax=Burkholderia ubonensis TaxID=101571 RepID=A0A102KWB8_9BURK|nr:hypothetical protein [Burkholderia ubonensis]AOI71760.1 hypothetical protein WI31_20725 [Burkholderia ubonensis]KUZ19935.1 hypothetical protein WI29_04905 [Burkholderia ubonensis]KUZ36447.1 hypothetical protein WI30_08950 [Burkholderia ubonensis]KUZ40020.1 hypothetical protein WI32_06750 [Burkholderia ubonensis]KUZ42542.1 hypothetical protein WI33_31245 [Burkholderia ubonensis]